MRFFTAVAPADRALAAALFLAIVAVPLVFTPITSAPFADPKLLVLTVAAAVAALPRLQVNRNIAVAAAIWVVAVVAAAAFGVDPLWSALGSPEQATGVVALSACAMLLCAASAAGSLRDRVPAWLFTTGVVVAALAVLGRFVDIGGSNWQLGNFSSTIGDRVFVGGFLAAAIVAATRLRPSVAMAAALVVVASGFSISAVRSAWAGAGVALLLVLWRTWPRWKPVAGVFVIVGVVLAVWTIVDRRVASPGSFELSATARFAQLGEGSAEERVPVWKANVRAWAQDPVFGSGPAAGWGAYLKNARPEELRIAARSYGDAHNLPIELLATTGAVGAAAGALLAAAVAFSVGRIAPDRAWAAGVAVAVGVVHLLQPINITLTPLLFVAAGLAANDASRVLRVRRWILIPLVVGVALASARFTASWLERYGDTYGSVAALDASLTFEPRRLSAAVELSRLLAFESGAGRPDLERDARALARANVRWHPWHPGVRLGAADVEAIMDDRTRAREWVTEHLRVFPNDSLALAGAAVLAANAGDDDEAERLARRALSLDPDSNLASGVLERLATSGGVD